LIFLHSSSLVAEADYLEDELEIEKEIIPPQLLEVKLRSDILSLLISHQLLFHNLLVVNQFLRVLTPMKNFVVPVSMETSILLPNSFQKRSMSITVIATSKLLFTMLLRMGI
jgi:hypothetical protein